MKYFEKTILTQIYFIEIWCLKFGIYSYMSKKVIVIGAGFASLSAASFLARDGYDVTILEKNSLAGGRARKFEAQGFTFDMGPSWYWMPDVFEKYFSEFDKQVSDYYDLVRLDPAYCIFSVKMT